MFVRIKGLLAYGIVTSLLLATSSSIFAGETGLRTLRGHLPKLPSGLASKGRLPETKRLHLAIGLPLRNEKGLDDFLAATYDPHSPSFRHYLTPDEFTARFG